MAHSRAAAIFTTACAPLIWGSTYLVTTEFLPPDRPLTAALLRVLPAGLLLLMYARVLPRRSEWSTVILLGILNIGFFQAMLFVAAYRLPGGLAAVLSSTQTLMVLLLTWLIGKTMPPKAAWLWAAAGVAGIALMVLSPQARYDAWGIAAALSGAASMSLGVYLSKHRKTSLPVLAFAGWQLLVGGLCLLPAALLAEPPLPALTLANIGGYLYLCLFGAVLAYVLFSEPVQSLAVRGKSADRDGLQGADGPCGPARICNAADRPSPRFPHPRTDFEQVLKGLARLPPAVVSSLGLLSPVCAFALGWLFLGQGMDGKSLLGFALALLSIDGVQRAASKK